MARQGQQKGRQPALAESVSLTLSEANLFDGVGGERVWCGDERGLWAVAIFVGHVSNLACATLREGKTGNHGNGHEWWFNVIKQALTLQTNT